MTAPDEGSPYRRMIPPAARPIHRAVPLLLRLWLLFGWRRTQWSLIVAGFLTLTLWSSAPNVDWGLIGFDGPTDRYLGEVVSMEPSGSPTREHGQHYRVIFTYEHDGRIESGTAFAGNHQLQEGYKVYVDVPRGHHEYAEVVGLGRPGMDHQTFFVLVVLALGVLGYVAATLVARRRVVRLVAHGRLAEGRLTSITSGWWHSPRDPVWKVHVVYEDAFGRGHGVVQPTLDLGSVAHGVPVSVVHDPDVPTRAVVLDVLPGEPRVVGNEVRFDPWLWRLFLALAPPAGFLAASVAGVFLAVC
jgi:hypothetical protein